MNLVAAGTVQASRPGVLERVKGQAEVLKWRLRGKPLPPPHPIKVDTILHTARQFGCRTLVETGTYLGDMIARTRHQFDRLYTIEVDARLHANACVRFRDDSAVTVLLGDSAQVLPKILESIASPAVFWLDGHYSGGDTGKGELDTPIQTEVELILCHPVRGHAILVDDARLFTGAGDYPTLSAFREQLMKLNASYHFAVKTDIIRFVPT
jgi:hypothetical protein